MTKTESLYTRMEKAHASLWKNIENMALSPSVEYYKDLAALLAEAENEMLRLGVEVQKARAQVEPPARLPQACCDPEGCQASLLREQAELPAKPFGAIHGPAFGHSVDDLEALARQQGVFGARSGDVLEVTGTLHLPENRPASRRL